MLVFCDKTLSASSSLLERITLKRGLTTASYVEMLADLHGYSQKHDVSQNLIDLLSLWKNFCRSLQDQCAISMFSRTAFFFDSVKLWKHWNLLYSFNLVLYPHFKFCRNKTHNVPQHFICNTAILSYSQVELLSSSIFCSTPHPTNFWYPQLRAWTYLVSLHTCYSAWGIFPQLRLLFLSKIVLLKRLDFS